MESCPKCKTHCMFPHGSDQEEFIKPMLPEDTTFHRCMNGHDWLSNALTGEDISEVTTVMPTGAGPVASTVTSTPQYSDYTKSYEFDLESGLYTVNEIRERNKIKAKIIADGLAGVTKEKPIRKVNRDYLTDEPTPRAITLKDEDVERKE